MSRSCHVRIPVWTHMETRHMCELWGFPYEHILGFPYEHIIVSQNSHMDLHMNESWINIACPIRTQFVFVRFPYEWVIFPYACPIHDSRIRIGFMTHSCANPYVNSDSQLCVHMVRIGHAMLGFAYEWVMSCEDLHMNESPMNESWHVNEYARPQSSLVINKYALTQSSLLWSDDDVIAYPFTSQMTSNAYGVATVSKID